MHFTRREKRSAPDGSDGEREHSGTGKVAGNNDETSATGPANSRNRSIAHPEKAPHRKRRSRSGSRRLGRAGDALGTHTNRILVSKASDNVVDVKAVDSGAVSSVGGSKGTAAADHNPRRVEAAVHGLTRCGKDGQAGDLGSAIADVSVVNRRMRRDSSRGHGGVVITGMSNEDYDSSDEAHVSGTTKVSPSAVEAGSKTSDDVSNKSLYRRDNGKDAPVTTPIEQSFRGDGNIDHATAAPDAPNKRCGEEVFAASSTASAPLSAREHSTYVGFSDFGINFPAERVGDGCNVPHVVGGLQSGQRSAATTANADAAIVLALKRTPPGPFRGTFWDEEDKPYAGNPDARLDPDSQDQGIRRAIETRKVGADKKLSCADDRGLVFESPIAPSLGIVCAPTADFSAGNCGDDADTMAEGTEGDPGREEQQVFVDKSQNSGDQLARRAEDESVSLAGSGGGQEDKNGRKVVSLSDGGLGKLALSSHTKTEENRREFFEVYRRMARQVRWLGSRANVSNGWAGIARESRSL